ncbi:AraC family transcriptional regulator [Rhizobium sp. TH135]|uniref:Helix-turn-helix domain-containing protein n=2 Tax=Rhizobium rhizophilum TaxID=1850373 RepID=A0ABY2QQP3_9HYPH|nr:helix-turn-helix domain-containing protein [Rhizobium rhizophilum]PLK69994.1 AraC family transcriptional regulator [Rhizobium sp. TH135]THV11810.1 helix-turn-helix domain-containing protein [Rhizobium rhizophilum]
MEHVKPLLVDESVPVHPDHDPRHPLVIFGDHRFCAGESLTVHRMAGPHMHSQIELNFVLTGQMTYWFDGRELTVDEGRLCLFWGMIPHQVTDRREGTRFVCLYVPMSVFLGLANLSRFRDAVFRGAMIEALEIRSWDRDIFQRWREELLAGDENLTEIVRNELTARVLRIERDGWRDLREEGSAIASFSANDSERVEHIERMLRFIAEHALENISADDVGNAVGLHPNYAMSIFKRAVGHTINQAIVRHRLDTAQSLLISTDLSITDVAFESGFGSVSRFYEAFSQRFVEKPTAFRRRMRSKGMPQA